MEKKYSAKEMMEFGDWCRNGLLNTEYNVDKLQQHLKDWEQLKKNKL